MTHDPREALEPCPFCNGEAEIHRRGDHRVSTIYRCTNCGCRLETGEEFSHGKRWNERAITASAPKAEPAADWSNLPKDIYVTGAERVDAVGFDVQCCSVPMVTAPEVRYVRADITSPPPAAGWNEAIEAAINVVKPWPGAEGLAQSEAERAVENIRREFVKALESLRREAPAPEGEAGYVPATGPIQSGDVLRYEVDEETNVGKVTAHLRPDAGGWGAGQGGEQPMKKLLPPQDILQAMFRYDPETGTLYRRPLDAGHFACTSDPRGPEWAARAYDSAARALHGEFAILNFPDEA